MGSHVVMFVGDPATQAAVNLPFWSFTGIGLHQVWGKRLFSCQELSRVVQLSRLQSMLNGMICCHMSVENISSLHNFETELALITTTHVMFCLQVRLHVVGFSS